MSFRHSGRLYSVYLHLLFELAVSNSLVWQKPYSPSSLLEMLGATGLGPCSTHFRILLSVVLTLND